MKKIFEGWMKVNGDIIDDLEKYIYEQMSSRSDISIMIGTDSYLKAIDDDSKKKPIKDKSKKKKRISYLTVICFKKGNNGCHVIKRRDEEIKIGFVPTAVKLNGEIDRTSALALWLRDDLNVIPEVHLDVNPAVDAGSFEVYKYIHGYFESLGFVCEYKPSSPAASFAADFFL